MPWLHDRSFAAYLQSAGVEHAFVQYRQRVHEATETFKVLSGKVIELMTSLQNGPTSGEGQGDPPSEKVEAKEEANKGIMETNEEAQATEGDAQRQEASQEEGKKENEEKEEEEEEGEESELCNLLSQLQDLEQQKLKKVWLRNQHTQ